MQFLLGHLVSKLNGRGPYNIYSLYLKIVTLSFTCSDTSIVRFVMYKERFAATMCYYPMQLVLIMLARVVFFNLFIV